MNLPDLPFVASLRNHQGAYVFPDRKSWSSSTRHALAGPFRDARGARLWILESLEAQLVDARRSVWVEVCKRLGSMSQDLGIELYLINMVLHGKTVEDIAPYVPRTTADRRMLAAGDSEAA